ncbi:MAG TPA: retropepsin-like aspartic protease, partial [bacterium]|nr:retropepsin-like aspartic protease [bacterium]
NCKMSILKKRIKLRGSKGEIEEEVLFDTGASYSCIKKGLAEKIANLELLPEPMEFLTAEGGRKIVGHNRISINFYINGDRFSDEFIVLEELSENVIIGVATLQKWRMKLDFENEEIIYDKRVTRLQII